MNAIAPTPALAETTTMTATADDSLLNFVAMAVRDSSIEVGKLDALLRMQRQIVADTAKLEFNRAFSAAQEEMQPVTRDASNDQTRSKYARLETIDAAIRPICTRHGFAMSFDSEPIADGVRIICEITHREGHSKTYRLEAGLDTAGAKGNANKTPMHGLGSAVSYLRRYLKMMVWDISLRGEDNDGNRQPPQRGDGRLSPAEIAELETLMRQTQTLETAFLKHMAPNLRSIANAPDGDFPRLKNALLTKANVLAQRAARQTGEAA